MTTLSKAVLLLGFVGLVFVLYRMGYADGQEDTEAEWQVRWGAVACEPHKDADVRMLDGHTVLDANGVDIQYWMNVQDMRQKVLTLGRPPAGAAPPRNSISA